MPEPKGSFGEYLKELRRDRGMTQQEIADACHMTVDAYAKYEQGHTKLDNTAMRIFELAAAFNVPSMDLLRAAAGIDATEMPNESATEQSAGESRKEGQTQGKNIQPGLFCEEERRSLVVRSAKESSDSDIADSEQKKAEAQPAPRNDTSAVSKHFAQFASYILTGADALMRENGDTIQYIAHA